VKGIANSAKRTRQVDHRRFDTVLADVVSGVGYDGFGCINYKLVDDTPQVFEVNPRVGGSMHHFVEPALRAYRAALAD
jgi:predicted ATP-grasp superfamily ATP-dependent carboligase